MQDSDDDQMMLDSIQSSSRKLLRNKSNNTSHSHGSNSAKKDSLKDSNSDLEVLKRNRSKYKGKNMYHNEAKNGKSSVSRINPFIFETPCSSKQNEKAKFIETLRTSLGAERHK